MYPLFKRLADLVGAIVLIIILLPFFIVIALLILISSRMFPFFVQERIGRGQKPFRMIKFSTMIPMSTSHSLGHITVKNDPRVTILGRWLRKTKLNELPQLFNILRGDMSFVGPRPQLKEALDKYPREIRTQLYEVRPGLTGLGSVYFRDEEHLLNEADDVHEYYKTHIAPYKAALELYYQNNLSFQLDFRLLWMTLYVLLFPRSKRLDSWYKKLRV